MPDSTPWSNAFAPCRLEWRPSPALTFALGLLGVLSGAGCVGSDLPRPWAWTLAAFAVVGGGLLAWREHRRAGMSVLIAPDGAVHLDGIEVQGFDVAWRGPLAMMRWQGSSRTEFRAWWPDALPATGRRELRLAMIRTASARGRDSMAP